MNSFQVGSYYFLHQLERKEGDGGEETEKNTSLFHETDDTFEYVMTMYACLVFRP